LTEILSTDIKICRSFFYFVFKQEEINFIKNVVSNLKFFVEEEKFFDYHRKFLPVAVKKDLYVKIVIGAETEDEEFEK